jgi:hypothetical protein
MQLFCLREFLPNHEAYCLVLCLFVFLLTRVALACFVCAQSTKQKLKVELIPRDSIRNGLDKKIAFMERKIQDEKKKYAFVFGISTCFCFSRAEYHFHTHPCILVCIFNIILQSAQRPECSAKGVSRCRSELHENHR